MLWAVLIAAPQWQAGMAVAPKVAELRRGVAETEDGLKHREQTAKKFEALRTELRACPKQLAQERLPTLMDEIAAMAKSAGVEVETIRQAEVRVAKKGSSKDAAAKPAEHLTMPIEILGRAGYHDVGRFLDALENAQQLYRVESMTIEADRRDALRHRVAMRVSAYVAVTTL